MAGKRRDERNRWRNKTVAFRVSPEEDALLEAFVQLSGLTKQDYIARRLLAREVVVQGNPRVYKALREQLERAPAAARYAVAFGLTFAVLVFGAYGVGYDASQFIYNQF